MLHVLKRTQKIFNQVKNQVGIGMVVGTTNLHQNQNRAQKMVSVWSTGICCCSHLYPPMKMIHVLPVQYAQPGKYTSKDVMCGNGTCLVCSFIWFWMKDLLIYI